MEATTRVAVVITKLTAGAGVVALNGATALDPRTFDVTLFYGAGDRLVGQAAAAGTRTVQLRHLAADISPLEDRKGVSELTDHLGGFDVVHTHSAKAGAVGRIAARRAGLPVVHTLHGFPFHDFQSRVRRAVYIDVERRLGRITDVFLAVGSTVAAEAIRLGIARADKVRVVPSSVDTGIPPATEQSRATARALLEVPQDALVVGTVGRLDYQKAPEHFVEAARRVRTQGVQFLWIGSGAAYADTQRRIVRAGMADRIRLLGDRDDVARLLPAFDLFAMSSRYEGIPCALVEAMVVGVPAVATAVNGVPEVIIPGQTGMLARAGDAGSLATVIDYALARPEQARRWAREARDLVVTRWAPRELAAILEPAYHEAMAGQRAGATAAIAAAQHPEAV